MSACGDGSALLASIAVNVRWGDMDAFGHVNNAVFLTYLEEARVTWLASLPGPGLRGTVAPVLANSTVNFLRPIVWPSQLVVDLQLGRLGRSSLTLAHRLRAADDASRVHADGSVVLVWIDTGTGSSVPLPDEIRALAS